MSDERHETVEQPVANCNTLNAAKMREALEQIHELLSIGGNPDTAMCIRYEAAYQIAAEALSAPPRNCDVGTAEEQERRWHANCGGDIPNCKHCKVYEQARKCGLVYDKNMIRFYCRFIWGQMPYQEGESDGIVSEIIECDDSVADIVSNMRDYADRTEKQGLYDLRECGTEYLRALADLIEAASKREVAELKHWIKSAARWIKCHDIYHTSGDDLIKQAKEMLNDDGEFLFKEGE